MAAGYRTVDELREECLRRAGEPQSSTSDFWTDSLAYMNKIQDILVLGGGVAVGRDLATSAGIYSQLVNQPMTDWYWLRKEGVLNTTKAISTGTLALTNASTAITFSSAPAASVEGWRVKVTGEPTIPRVLTHVAGSTSATLDAEWVEATYTAATYVCYKEKYSLASDFLRFSGAPQLHSNYLGTINVTSREQMLTQMPMQLSDEGEPNVAAMIAPKTIVFDTYDTNQGWRFEYDYIALPSKLVAGATPVLPEHHRVVLAVGAAMLIMFDKHDSRAENLASEYREILARMNQEHRMALTSGSSTFGQFKCRQGGVLGRRASQRYGERYLV